MLNDRILLKVFFFFQKMKYSETSLLLCFYKKDFNVKKLYSIENLIFV
jgi:hypothetical protein